MEPRWNPDTLGSRKILALPTEVREDSYHKGLSLGGDVKRSTAFQGFLRCRVPTLAPARTCAVPRPSISLAPVSYLLISASSKGVRDVRCTLLSRHLRKPPVGPRSAMCGRLRVGKDFLHVAGLVGADMCSAY